jgi:hypothetical protein
MNYTKTLLIASLAYAEIAQAKRSGQNGAGCGEVCDYYKACEEQIL